MASGKSALLVHWARRLEARNPATHHVLFLPISVRFGTNAPAAVFEALAACLAAIGGTRIPAPTRDPVLHYREQAAGQLRNVAPTDGRPCVVIIDGLDEADALDFWLETFPACMSPALKLVVAARPWDDSGATGWLRRLKWDQPQRPSRVLEIGPLGEVAIVELVGTLKPPLSSGRLVKVASALARQSAGDALLLRWLVQDLQSELAATGELDAVALEARPAGLAAFVRDELTKHSAATGPGAAQWEEVADAAMAVLAGAFGPLPEDDLWDVLQRMPSEIPGRQRLFKLIGRFVTRNHDGRLALAHPRLAQLVTEELLAHSPVLKQATEKMLAWQVDVAEAFEKMGPARPSPYLLAYHARHLAKAAYTRPASVTVANWAHLTSKGWLKAKTNLSGWTGVAEDIGAVQRALHNPAAGGDRAAMAALLRAALVMASFRSWGAAAQPALLWLACRGRIISVPEAEQSAAALEPEDQSEALALLVTVEEKPERREQLLERSLDAATDVGRGDKTWRSADGAAKALESVLDQERIPELVERITGNGIRFVPTGLAFLCARLADAASLPNVAGAISDRLSGVWRARFLLACAERLVGDLRNVFLREALTAARAERDIEEEVKALLELDRGSAQARAKEWLAALGPRDYLVSSSLLAKLGALCALSLLDPGEIEPVLQRIANQESDEHFPWVFAQRLASHRKSFPTLDGLLRSTLAKAVEPQAGLQARSVLSFSSAALTGEERATLRAAIVADSPDTRAILLARLLAGTPREDSVARTELAEEAKAATLLVDPPSLRMSSLFELAAADDDCVTWCANQAFEVAAGSKEALNAFHSSAMLHFAEVADPAIVSSRIPQLLRRAWGAGSAPSQWLLRLALVADSPEMHRATAVEAYAAARAQMPDADAAIGILDYSIGAMSPEMRRQAFDQGLQWLRAEEDAVDTRSMAARERALRQASFTIRSLTSAEMTPLEFWETLGEYRALGIAVETEAAIAWKYEARVFEAPVVHVKWFNQFELAYLKRVKDIPFAIDHTVAYWVTCAHFAPTKLERRRFILDGWRHLISKRNPWKADDDGWEPQREERATGLYALAMEAPWWLSFLIRRTARKVVIDSPPERALEPGSHAAVSQQAVRRFLTKFIDNPPASQRRGDGYAEAAQHASRLATAVGEPEISAALVSLLQEVASLSRGDALDVLSQAPRRLVEMVGLDAIKAATDDVAEVWP